MIYTKMRVTVTAILLFIACCSISEGVLFVSGLAAVTINRKTFWKNLGAGAAVAFAPAFTPEANAFDLYTFNHQYEDPKHPNCKRVVVVKRDGITMVSGTEGTPACPEDGSGEVFRLVGEAEDSNLTVDFSLAGGPDEVKGVWDGDGIKWSDGNKWYIKGMAPSPQTSSETSSDEGKETVTATN